MKEQAKHYQKMPLTQNFQNVKCLTYGGHLLNGTQNCLKIWRAACYFTFPEFKQHVTFM